MAGKDCPPDVKDAHVGGTSKRVLSVSGELHISQCVWPWTNEAGGAQVVSSFCRPVLLLIVSCTSAEGKFN